MGEDDEMSELIEEYGEDIYDDDYLDNDEALSYVWGPPYDPKTSSVISTPANSGGRVFVTQNLEMALRSLRSKTERRVLWVDAVCINQDDVSGKGRQVSLMGKIYGLAKTATVWLGPEENDSDAAFALLEDLGRSERDANDLVFEPLGRVRIRYDALVYIQGCSEAYQIQAVQREPFGKIKRAF
ncbi:putative Heterokaryon incompatibility domain-containing protein [Seiridium cardinale]